MTQPVATKTWGFSVNNRSTFTSLNQVMGDYLYGIKNALVGAGWTVKYTCDGTTGPTSSSDHTDRWAGSANARTRGAGAANAQSFAVLTGADGCDTMLTYQGGADNTARISHSPGGLFVPAATSNQQPTATDESVQTAANTDLINGTASLDRIWNCQWTTDKKSWRAWVFRSNVVVGTLIGVDDCASSKLVQVTQPIVGKFGLNIGSGSLGLATLLNTAGTTVGAARITAASSIAASLTVEWENWGSSPTLMVGVNAELQGANGTLAQQLGLISFTTGSRGEFGNFVDLWASFSNSSDGDITTDKKLIVLTGSGGNSGGVMLPWDGASAVTKS